MIILGILAILFATFFILRKHVGTAMLASFAGMVVHSAALGFFATLHKTTHIPLEMIENIAFLTLVLVVPLIIYILSKRSWSRFLIRIINSLIFSLLVVSLGSGILRQLLPIDLLSRDILNFISSNQGFIYTASIIVAYFNVLLPHKNYE